MAVYIQMSAPDVAVQKSIRERAILVVSLREGELHINEMNLAGFAPGFESVDFSLIGHDGNGSVRAQFHYWQVEYQDRDVSRLLLCQGKHFRGKRFIIAGYSRRIQLCGV